MGFSSPARNSISASPSCPYYPSVAGALQNSIIGGANLWVMGGKKPEEYKGVAKFFLITHDPQPI
jgi:sn-glycerol 3-phosphate transport system substrate-binding protein